LHDATHTSQPLETSSSTTMGDQGEQAIPVVQEELRVGKRDVRRGGVRVFSEIREQPVQENVQLRDETIRVERRSVDRPIDTREFDAFREGTIELTETDEEAVVEKRARVKEEVVISKDVDTRTETIRDTVRSTDVRVENTGTTSNYDTDFRNDFTTRYAGRGHQYDRYQPAYEFGHRYASDQRYNNRDWSVVEPDLRRDWESRGHGTWEDFKDSIRYGWDKVRGRR
ncbi:MAG TPA: YsnF/AvaK domain-containing protein, partial [Bryobacteraceae bacterium]|nr:YsnF/AvaK domain-containing protein [Bryobacteraceae bacterium]